MSGEPEDDRPPDDGGPTDGGPTDGLPNDVQQDGESADDDLADDDPADDGLPKRERVYETRVPPGDSPVRCPHCERPLESEALLALHKGLDHWERLTDEEREAFREAYTDEADDLRTFRLKMLGLLILVYFAFLFVYSYFTTDPFSAAMLVVGWTPANAAPWR